jgi:hypothetical protein
VASFGAISFGEGQGGRSFPVWGRAAEHSVTHIPGGNISILQTSGKQADTLSLPIQCTAAQLASLYSAVDTVATLIYSYGSRSAYLSEVSNVEEQQAGQDMYFATLKLIGR